VGSHLSRHLLAGGCRVIGIDCFTDYYDRNIKEDNIADLLNQEDFTLIRGDISEIDDSWFNGEHIQWIFHQAAQAGVRASWGTEFAHYTHHNVLGTQRLLEWARHVKPERLVYASSSSVYGAVTKLPMHEEDLPRPMSPYGVTKLAAEHLCNLYYQNFAVPTVSLRYFTVYGPGQRPDMAFHRFIRAIRNGQEIVVYGSGEQTRDFTYIDDIVAANLAAASTSGAAGWVYNIGGGSCISVNGVLEILGRLTGKVVRVRHEEVQAGDPPHTYADTARAQNELGFRPQVELSDGLAHMVKWLKSEDKR
ncbi:MAG: NAD-dependent epimerase/dehydratase family protein, partial [Dethiobacteria bacterium]|nr:NAD-dependent epimerase/dehydratase family protein [Dethiobacteria bacterium]